MLSADGLVADDLVPFTGIRMSVADYIRGLYGKVSFHYMAICG